MDATTTTDTIVLLTDSAAEKATMLLNREGNSDLALRLAVQPGGCSGLRYQIFFDDRTLDGDVKWVVPSSEGELPMVVDKLSVPYLTGATLGYADRIDAQGFTIDNPNATNSCACGDSFY